MISTLISTSCIVQTTAPCAPPSVEDVGRCENDDGRPCTNRRQRAPPPASIPRAPRHHQPVTSANAQPTPPSNKRSAHDTRHPAKLGTQSRTARRRHREWASERRRRGQAREGGGGPQRAREGPRRVQRHVTARSAIYRHPDCLNKHRWEHTRHWREASKFVLSKHQQVQLLEAAAILSYMGTPSTSLPDYRSEWPSFLSGGCLRCIARAPASDIHIHRHLHVAATTAAAAARGPPLDPEDVLHAGGGDDGSPFELGAGAGWVPGRCISNDGPPSSPRLGASPRPCVYPTAAPRARWRMMGDGCTAHERAVRVGS